MINVTLVHLPAFHNITIIIESEMMRKEHMFACVFVRNPHSIQLKRKSASKFIITGACKSRTAIKELH